MHVVPINFIADGTCPEIQFYEIGKQEGFRNGHPTPDHQIYLSEERGMDVGKIEFPMESVQLGGLYTLARTGQDVCF